LLQVLDKKENETNTTDIQNKFQGIKQSVLLEMQHYQKNKTKQKKKDI